MPALMSPVAISGRNKQRFGLKESTRVCIARAMLGGFDRHQVGVEKPSTLFAHRVYHYSDVSARYPTGVGNPAGIGNSNEGITLNSFKPIVQYLQSSQNLRRK